MQLNLSNCALTAPIIYRTFSGISFRVYRVLDFEVTQPSKFTINLRNEVRSETKGGLYASAHRIIISSSNCNCLCNLGLYCFPECANACMIPLEAVSVFPFQLVFESSIFDQRLQHRFFIISNKIEYTRSCELVRWLHRVEVFFHPLCF